MITIKYKVVGVGRQTLNYNPDRTLEWKLDDGLPSHTVTEEVNVLSVTATGVERTYLEEHFKGLPMALGKASEVAVTWRGEFARFIFDNL